MVPLGHPPLSLQKSVQCSPCPNWFRPLSLDLLRAPRLKGDVIPYSWTFYFWGYNQKCYRHVWPLRTTIYREISHTCTHIHSIDINPDNLNMSVFVSRNIFEKQQICTSKRHTSLILWLFIQLSNARSQTVWQIPVMSDYDVHWINIRWCPKRNHHFWRHVVKVWGYANTQQTVGSGLYRHQLTIYESTLAYEITHNSPSPQVHAIDAELR